MRELKCDHAIEEAVKHPVAYYINIGNMIIGMCGTCYNALKGQVYESDIIQVFRDDSGKKLNGLRKRLKNEKGSANV